MSSKGLVLAAVELFAGIGGFRIAADAKQFRTLWANDIDSKACSVYRARFGDGEIHEGDIHDLESSVPHHDLLTAGFPCQPFSSAGKKRGTRDPRGTLFQSIVNILRSQQPDFFVLENVKRLLSMEDGSHFATILSVLAELDYWIEWRLVNACHFGLAQNRQRVAIVGIHHRVLAERFGGRRTVRLLDRSELSALSSRRIEHLIARDAWQSIGDHGQRFPTWGVAECGRFFGESIEGFAKAQPAVLLRAVLEEDVDKAFDFTESTLERIENSRDVGRFVDGVEILTNQSGGARMGYTVFGVNGVAPTLTASTSRHYERYRVGNTYRRLTNTEYARLQGFPDHHCDNISVYDQYMLYGNAVPPSMAEWVMDRMLADGIAPETINAEQRDLFTQAS